ncbi:MAG: hypothetical protein Q4F34_02900, partial [Prevotellaceae bacterium]|nr:hypothetical protein [Prevotellaceae bacterium]
MKKSYLLTTLLLLFASPSFAYSDSYGTSGYDVFECIILLIFGILSIILFFKIWAMTDNVAKITTLFTESVNVKQENSLLAYYIRKEINGVEEANKFLTKCIIEDIESITSTNECTRKKYENAFNGVK